jgi:hypothetical protein
MSEHRGGHAKHREGHAVRAEKGGKHRLILERHVKLFVVRDRGIALGGTYVKDLAEFKTKVMAHKNQEPWTLVLAIHGAVDHVAAQMPPDREHMVKYTAEDLTNLFSAADWITWRETHGPSHLVLTACQVNSSLEGVLIRLLTRSGPSQQAPQGLGQGCKPSVESDWPIWNGQPIKEWKQFKNLDPDGQNYVTTTLKARSRTWGYYGAPPVPDAKVLEYFFDEVPRGEWPKVAVGLSAGPGLVRRTDLPYWNRIVSADFAKLCPAADRPPEARRVPGITIPRP